MSDFSIKSRMEELKMFSKIRSWLTKSIWRTKSLIALPVRLFKSRRRGAKTLPNTTKNVRMLACKLRRLRTCSRRKRLKDSLPSKTSSPLRRSSTSYQRRTWKNRASTTSFHINTNISLRNLHSLRRESPCFRTSWSIWPTPFKNKSRIRQIEPMRLITSQKNSRWRFLDKEMKQQTKWMSWKSWMNQMRPSKTLIMIEKSRSWIANSTILRSKELSSKWNWSQLMWVGLASSSFLSQIWILNPRRLKKTYSRSMISCPLWQLSVRSKQAFFNKDRAFCWKILSRPRSRSWQTISPSKFSTATKWSPKPKHKLWKFKIKLKKSTVLLMRDSPSSKTKSINWMSLDSRGSTWTSKSSFKPPKSPTWTGTSRGMGPILRDLPRTSNFSLRDSMSFPRQ